MKMMFSNIARNNYQNSRTNKDTTVYYKNIKQITVNNTNSNNNDEINKMKWGKPVWYFLHSAAEKIKAEEFHNIRKELLEIIYLICTNLPCPYCSHHAKIYLDNINFENITNKDDLIYILYCFHNHVNKEKKYKLFDFNNLNELYSKANFINMTNNFLFHFNEKYNTNKLINGQVFKNTISKKITNWLKLNIQRFN